MTIVGMDFGTTNSGMAVFDGRSVDILGIDPGSPNPRVARTALYITTEQDIVIGRAAIDRYFSDNIGRPVRMQKVWIGEIEVIADEVYYIQDVYSWTDTLSPGRLFLSLKTQMRDVGYPGTVISQFYYSLEDLIALYLSVTRSRAEAILERPLTEVVLGRPVHFADNEEHDRIAEARLLQAAFRAGYERVYLQYEPVAAAYSYEQTLSRPENVLIFDFGGGTLDITIMRLGGGEHRVLATGGIPVAGDVFDQKVVRAKLPRHFGEGSLYGPRHKALTVPTWIYDSFSNWQTILELHAADNRKILRDIAQTAQRRYQLEALTSLVSGNYGLQMFDIVEQAKRTLSGKRGAEIYLDGPGFSVREFITRNEFETIIRNEIRAIEDHLLTTLVDSGLRPDEIDTVIRTGGSSEIPAFHDMLGRHFGAEKVNSIDTFSSVTAGLGITAHRVEQGEIELKLHTRAEFEDMGNSSDGRLAVTPVNMDLLQRRIELAERSSSDPALENETALILLGDPGTSEEAIADIAVYLLPAEAVEAPFLLEKAGWNEQPVRQALTAAPDDQLLFVTSRYRFLTTTARQLHDAQEIGLAFGNLYRLINREVVSLVINWTQARECERLLLITSMGIARAYLMDVLRPSIEAPVPYQFDNPPDGLPVLMAGAAVEDQVVIVTESGRGVRWPVDSLPLIGLQAINCGRDERFDRVAAAVLAGPEDELVLVLDDAYGRRLRAEWVSVPTKANQKGRALVARKATVAALSQLQNGRLSLVTNNRIVTVDGTYPPLEESKATLPLLRAAEEERVTAVLPG